MVILRKSVSNDRVHVSPGLVLGGSREGGGVADITCVFLWGFLLEDSNAEKNNVRRLVRAYWNLVHPLEEAWRVVMKKMGRQEKRFHSETLRNTNMEGLWKSHGTVHLWRSYRDCWTHLVIIWWMIDWILSKNCRNTLPLQTVDQLASSAKNESLLWLARMKWVKIWAYWKA